jgi:ribosomal protein L31
MKKGTHPENYRLVAFKDMSNEDVLSLNLLQIQEKQLQLMVLNTQL